MVAEASYGEKGNKETPLTAEVMPDRIGARIVQRYQAWAEDEGVFDELFASLKRNLNAQTTKRIEDETRESGYTYEKCDDGMTQVAAARTLAQILRLMPASGGNSLTLNQTSQTINVSAEQRVAELESIGVPKEQMREACLAMLEVASKPDTAPKA